MMLTYARALGRYIRFADGGYPMIYFTEAAATICADCADDTDSSDPVLGCDVFYEGPRETCADCGTEIASAYGDPDCPRCAGEQIDPCPECGPIPPDAAPTR